MGQYHLLKGIINDEAGSKFTFDYFVLNRLILSASFFLVLSNDISIFMTPFSVSV